MKIENIHIIESKSEKNIASLNTEAKIKSVFNRYRNIISDEIFELNDSVYSVEDVSLILLDSLAFEVQVQVTFVSLISDVT